MILLSSCASTFTGGGITNTGTMITDNNFVYVGKVTGTASSTKMDLLLFKVDLDDGQAYRRAMADINNKAGLYDGSKKGLINVTHERISSRRFLFSTHTVTITADVVEFIDG